MKYTESFSDETDYKLMMGIIDPKIQSKLVIVLTELQKARSYFAKPFNITSGYRTQEYNKKVGGAVNSQHTKGEAIDFMCNGNLFIVFDWISKKLEYDQVIYESKNGTIWIHFSKKESGNRKEALIAEYDNKTKVYKYTAYKG